MIIIFLILILFYIFSIKNKTIKKYIIHSFLIIMSLLFYTMCIKYTRENYYIADEVANFSKSEITDMPIELKGLYISSNILYIEALKRNNLLLDKIEIFYQNRRIGIIEIRKNINDIEDLTNVKENGFYKKNYSLQQGLLMLLGKNDEKIHIGSGYYRLFRLDIYIKDLKSDKVYIIKKSVQISFEKKVFKLFIPSI